MPAPHSNPDAPRVRRLLPLTLIAPLLLGAVVSIGILAFSELGYRRLEAANKSIGSTLQIQSLLHEVLALLVDAETSQRGYLLTGHQDYLVPYRAAVPRIEERFKLLREQVAQYATPSQRERVARFNNLIGKKLNELEATIALHERAGRDAAFELLNTGIGQRTMDQIRGEVAAIADEHSTLMAASAERWDRDVAFSRHGMQAMTALALALLALVWLLLRREMRLREDKRRQLVVERERLEAEVDRRTAELSELSNHLQTVREEEKARLARDIHDELGGVLVSAKMDVTWAEQHLHGTLNTEVRTKLRRAMELLDSGVTLKRRIIEELRPSLLDNLGLGPAVEWLAHQTCDRAGIALKVTLPADPPPLPPDISIALYRIAQESLTNVLKYAKANKVELEIEQTRDAISMLIADDGIGIPAKASMHHLSHGISGMRQRVRALGGEFSIHSTPGRGTMIEVIVPLPKLADDEASPAAAEELR